MKFLKHILLFLFSLLLNWNVSAKEIVVVENQNVFFEIGDNHSISKEHSWLGLLYLQENSKLATSNDKIGLPCGQNFSRVNANVIDAWEKLDDLDISPAFRRNIDNLTQRSVLDEFGDNIATATNKQKGNFGEIGMDLDLNAKGYESLQPRISSINEAGHNGLDGVYRKNGQYYIVEGKYTGSASLNPANPNTGLFRQMSDDWIATRNWDEINLAPNIVEDLLDAKNYQRVLAKVAPDGSVTYKLVDADVYVITGNAGVFNP